MDRTTTLMKIHVKVVFLLDDDDKEKWDNSSVAKGGNLRYMG